MRGALTPTSRQEAKEWFRSEYASGGLMASVFIGIFLGSLMDDILIQEELMIGFMYAVTVMSLGRKLFQLPSFRRFGYYVWETLRQFLVLMCVIWLETSYVFLRISLPIGAMVTSFILALLLVFFRLVSMHQQKILHPETDTGPPMAHERLVAALVKRFLKRFGKHSPTE